MSTNIISAADVDIHCIGQKVDFVDFVELFAGSFNHRVFLGVFWPWCQWQVQVSSPEMVKALQKATCLGISLHLQDLQVVFNCSMQVEAAKQPMGSMLILVALWEFNVLFQAITNLMVLQTCSRLDLAAICVNLPCRGFCRSGFVYLYSKCIEIYTVHTHYFTLDGFSKCEHCSMHICKVSVGYCSGLHCFHAFSFVVLSSTALLSRSGQKSDELQETSRASKEFGHRAALFVSFPAGLPGIIAHFQTCAFDQGAAANCSVTSPS